MQVIGGGHCYTSAAISLPSISRTTDLPVTPCLAGRRLGLALMRPAIFVTSQACRSISSAIRSHLQQIDSGLND
jgi:hypothetical protein